MRKKLRESPILANALLFMLAAIVVGGLAGSEGKPLLFLKKVLEYLAYAGLVVVSVIVVGRLGGGAVEAVSHNRQMNKSARKKKKK